MTEEVIDWKNALEKCGDDEDFLKELLVDLRKEAAEHKAAIDGASATVRYFLAVYGSKLPLPLPLPLPASVKTESNFLFISCFI